jgi:hypothetical protein
VVPSVLDVIETADDDVDGSEGGYENELPSVGLKTITESRVKSSSADRGRLLKSEQSGEHLGHAV